jgi:hypothetical protein
MRFLACTGAAALAAAALLPGAPLGIAVPVVAALVAAAIGRRPWPLALAAAPVLRDAGWVVALDLGAAVLLTSIVLAGGETLGQIARGAAAFLTRLPAVPKLVTLPNGLRSLGPAAFGTALGGVLVVPFGLLFSSADGAFAQLLQDALPAPGLLPGRTVALVTVAVAAAGFHAAARGGAPSRGPAAEFGLDRLETSIALGLLNALFLLFVAVQLAVLFGGRDHVLGTAHLSYAEYARSGFWQLLVVAALTLAVIAAARRWARPHPLLLALLAALCLVVVASSLRRMGVYEDVYGFTRLRISVQAIDLWLAGLLLLALTPGRLAPRAAVAWTGIALAAFTLANPDRLIARHNVGRFQATGRIDTGYLRTLSADARPELRQLPARLRVLALVPAPSRGPWSSWSLSRT